MEFEKGWIKYLLIFLIIINILYLNISRDINSETLNLVNVLSNTKKNVSLTIINHDQVNYTQQILSQDGKQNIEYITEIKSEHESIQISFNELKQEGILI